MFEKIDQIPIGSVQKEIAIDDNRILVLINYEIFRDSKARNLTLYCKGDLVWSACPPEYSDAFTNLTMDAGGLFAETYSGWRVKIDLTNGAVEKVAFMK